MSTEQTIHPSHRRLLTARPPIPREHGAWAILYVPYVIGTVAAGAAELVPSLLLLVAITAAFLAREPAANLVKPRRTEGAAAWLLVYGTAGLASVAVLLTAFGATSLLRIAWLAAAAFGIHLGLQAWPARKRLDRSLWGELISMSALTLTGPAAYAVTHGRLNSEAWFLWAATTLFFGSGILHVKMLLAAVKIKGDFTTSHRRQAGFRSFVYHMLALWLVLWAALSLGGSAGLLLAVSYLPMLARAFYGCATLTNQLPPLKKVGFLELGYSLWFAGFFIAALLSR